MQHHFFAQCLKKVREKRPKTRILLHYDYTSPHTANKTMSFLTSEKVKLVTHPAFSPDLTPCDFFIFSKIKYLMTGLTFTEPEDTVLAFNQHVQNMPSDQ
ncbi:Histone-lysine N-methyltransferase SETMAR [Eumeta japonica]|uniref:Histone-lysine N-methyltransferase SETMAR n=1 Tax=Eumeta variegata TaxID=151549 RepID=A0A4C1VPI3_EUMVA|nr:Histone-lysine N-methyltransferase SETMAR [Eumeta japonica]